MFSFIVDVLEVAVGVVLADQATKFVVKHEAEIKQFVDARIADAKQLVATKQPAKAE